MDKVIGTTMADNDSNRAAQNPDSSPTRVNEKERVQQKQGGHHMPPRPEDGPPLDDTDRSTDKIIEPVAQERRLGKRHLLGNEK